MKMSFDLNSIRKAPGAANTEGFELVSFDLFRAMSTTPRSEERTLFLSHIQSRLSKRKKSLSLQTVSSWPLHRTAHNAPPPN